MAFSKRRDSNSNSSQQNIANFSTDCYQVSLHFQSQRLVQCVPGKVAFVLVQRIKCKKFLTD